MRNDSIAAHVARAIQRTASLTDSTPPHLIRAAIQAEEVAHAIAWHRQGAQLTPQFHAVANDLAMMETCSRYRRYSHFYATCEGLSAPKNVRERGRREGVAEPAGTGPATCTNPQDIGRDQGERACLV